MTDNDKDQYYPWIPRLMGAVAACIYRAGDSAGEQLVNAFMGGLLVSGGAMITAALLGNLNPDYFQAGIYRWTGLIAGQTRAQGLGLPGANVLAHSDLRRNP